MRSGSSVQKWPVDVPEEVPNRARVRIGGIPVGQRRGGGQPSPERSSWSKRRLHTTSHEIH